MNVLVCGAKGFVGQNFVENLKNIRDGKNRTTALTIDQIFEYDIDTDSCLLPEYCKNADFVFNFAGVNRPKTNEEFYTGNSGFTEYLVKCMSDSGCNVPCMLASSIQVVSGRHKDTDYGKSKLLAENILFDYSEKSGVPVYVFRFPNLFGKNCRPNYNSAVATFCYNIANDLPITINDENTELELLYIDDLCGEMLNILSGFVHKCSFEPTFSPDENGKFCYVPVTHRVTLGEIADLLYKFAKQPTTLLMPEIPDGSFAKKLYSTYLSYLPKEKMAFPLKMNIDNRGSFTELLKTDSCGQFSVNISLPGITKGQHWHNSKWELFIVVSGTALIQQRKIGTEEILEFRVSGDEIQAVTMIPGYTHSITNLSDTEKLVTLMWANEQFNPDFPDTFYQAIDDR